MHLGLIVTPEKFGKNSQTQIQTGALFSQLNVREMALVLSDMVLDIFPKNIPNKIRTCHDKDAAWITPQVKTAIDVLDTFQVLEEEAGGTCIEIQYRTSKLITEA